MLAVANIGDTSQELNARATSFLIGKHYSALVTSRLDETTYLVKVEQSFYRMNLGTSASVGQNLVLQYLQDSPTPTFSLLQNSLIGPENGSSVIADVSAAAHLIDDSLQQAQAAGVSSKYEARTVVSHSPVIPEVLAHDLKKALDQSGLFYESHLRDYLAGHRSLSDIKLERQNQQNIASNALLPQQLAILENQRLSWSGEIWPSQEMSWDVYLPDGGKEKQAEQARAEENHAPISTDLTLHLPNLGKVTAKISLTNGRMRIGLVAEESQARSVLQAQSGNLAGAIVRNGQVLESLTVGI